MNFEQFQYTVAGFKAIEVYPFTKKTKRYLRGYRQNAPEQLYRIVVYPYHLVKTQPLIAHLNRLKGISHNILGKIIHLYQETQLIKIGQKLQKETVIAVVVQDSLNQEYINLYDFIVKMGNISQRLAQDIVLQLLSFIKFMQDKGFVNSFNSNELFFQKNYGKICFDNYGDSSYFLVKQQTNSDIWQLGSLLFTLLKGNPPYSKKSQSDPFYNCLNKGQFQKFWGIVSEKPIKNPSLNASNFLNKCFEKQATIQILHQHEWLQNFAQFTEQQRMAQITNIIQRKLQRLNEIYNKQNERKQRIAQAARERACLAHKRGTQTAHIQTFLDYLFSEQECVRPINKQNVSQQQAERYKYQIAHFLTLLKLNENKDVNICEIRDQKDIIIFRIKTQLGSNLHFDAQVQIGFLKLQKNLNFVCQRIQGAQFYETLWINNYIQELLQQI